MIDIDLTQLPSLPFEDRWQLPDEPGIYFAIRGDEILYIGRSVRLAKRWGSHRRSEQLERQDNVRLVWLSASPDDLVQLEREMIERFQPTLNNSRIPICYGDTVSCHIRFPRELFGFLESEVPSRYRSVQERVIEIVRDAHKLDSEERAA